MSRNIWSVVGVLLLCTAAGAEDTAILKSQVEKVSYSIGVDIGTNFKRQSIEVDPELLARGIKDALGGAKTLLTEDEVRATLTAFQQEVRAKQAENAKKQGEKNKQEGEAFLTGNKAKEGVVTLESGLQYKVLKMGDGPKPAADDTVECHYRGTLIDGTEFDSSFKRGQPASFPVKGVIKGWTEALQLMPVGSKWQLFIPSGLAYGERGAGAQIGPNAALVFEIELLGIKPKQAPPHSPMPSKLQEPKQPEKAEEKK